MVLRWREGEDKLWWTEKGDGVGSGSHDAGGAV